MRNNEDLRSRLANKAVLIKKNRPVDALVRRAQEWALRHWRLQVCLSGHRRATVIADDLRFIFQYECERHLRSNG